MNYLSNQYRPVELYLIVKKSQIEFIDCLVLILVELLSKGVLEVKYANVGNNVEAYHLMTGQNFDSYDAESMDQIFLKPFIKNNRIKLQFKHALQIGLQLSKNKKRVIKNVFKSGRMDDLLVSKLWTQTFSHIWLNKKGQRLSEQILREISGIGQKIDNLKSQPDQNHLELFGLFRNRYYFLRKYDPREIFGSNILKYLDRYKQSGYDVHYEMSFDYFKNRLQLAHAELLQMDYLRDKYEDEIDDSWIHS